MFPGLQALLGNVPRSTSHLGGIVAMAFVHTSISHLLANTLPLVCMGALIAVQQAPARFVVKILLINLGTGCLVWIFARQGLHVGASGLVFGLFGLILAHAALRRAFVDLLIGAMVLGLFGGLLLGVVPGVQGVSWESHVAGLVVGFGVGAASRERGRSG